MTNPRIVIADDHLLVAEGVAKLLRPVFHMVDIVADGQDLLSFVQSDPPDLAIIDISLPTCNGFDAVREIKKNHPTVKMIMLTMHKESDFIRQAFQAGASGYVLKDAAGLELLQATKVVLQGGRYLPPNIPKPDKVLSSDSGPTGQTDSQKIRLTSRQKVVLQLLVEGKTNKEMADVLKLSLKTIEFHKTRIRKTVGVKNTAELTQYALQHHLAIL
ncbi:MAG: response regulator [Nitrospirales bacterium]|nr:response regulator transcription factor [Nitrospirales bacterium]